MKNNLPRIALAGNPNSGKSTLFNALTGASVHVGNWPGVTVEKKEGVYSNSKGQKASVIDLPGIYSLSPYSGEEVVARNELLSESVDLVCCVVDATNLQRNLYLTSQILELDVPVVVALNMMDEAVNEGIHIGADALSSLLDVPVVPISALKGEGVPLLMETILSSLSPAKGRTILKDSSILEKAEKAEKVYRGAGIPHSLFHAFKALEGDEQERNANPFLTKEIDSFKGESDYEESIALARYDVLSEIESKVLRIEEKKVKHSKSEKADKVFTSKIWGIPIFLAILFVIFHLTFGADLLYLHAFGVEFPTFAEGTFFEGLFYGEDGIASLGVLLQNFVNCCTDGLTELVRTGLVAAAGEESFVVGLVCDGVLGGVFSVISFLPQVMLLYFFFSILEDSGYMARAAFLLDRVFRGVGLSGRAFIPMIMGFGCSVPAMMNTRTLTSDEERIATIRVIPFFPCSAKAVIISAVSAAVASMYGMDAGLVSFSMYVLGMVTGIALVVLMHKTTLRGDTPPFVMELPPYRFSTAKNLWRHTFQKGKHFVVKAFTIILASTIVIWFLSHFAWNWSYLGDEEISSSILASIASFIQPLFTPLGFGAQLGENGWVYSVSVVSGLIAKESAIATFETLAGGLYEGSEAVVVLLQATNITKGGILAFLAYNLLTIPCFAAMGSARSELPKGTFRNTVIFYLMVSYVVPSFVYLAVDFIWPLAIIVPFIVLLFVAAFLYDKKKTKKEAQHECCGDCGR